MADFENLETFRYPVYIKIIGFGDATKSTIEAINSLEYAGLEAIVAVPDGKYAPSDEDKMVILLVTEQTEQLHAIAKAYFESDALTIGIMSDSNLSENVKTDSFTIVDYNRIYDTVRTLIDPIFMHGYICYNFYDFNQTMADTTHFQSLSVIGSGNNRVTQAIDSITNRFINKQSAATEHLSLFLYYNRDGKQPVLIHEAAILSDFLNRLPENIDKIFAVYHDPAIKSNEIRLSMIASGKELPPYL